jgi:hypothetical protein
MAYFSDGDVELCEFKKCTGQITVSYFSFLYKNYTTKKFRAKYWYLKY